MNVAPFAQPIRSGVFAALALLVCACSSAPPVGPYNMFVGSWLCTDNVSFAASGEAGAPSATRMSTMDLAIVAPTTDQLNTLAKTDAGASCGLHFTMNGSNASLASGQSCARAGGLTLAYSMGTATVVGGAQLNMSLSFDVVASDPSTAAQVGSGSESLGCQRAFVAPVGGGW